MTNQNKSTEQDEIHNEDFQFVLKELLRAYQPILEEDLERAKSPDQLTNEAEQNLQIVKMILQWLTESLKDSSPRR